MENTYVVDATYIGNIFAENIVLNNTNNRQLTLL